MDSDNNLSDPETAQQNMLENIYGNVKTAPGHHGKKSQSPRQ